MNLKYTTFILLGLSLGCAGDKKDPGSKPAFALVTLNKPSIDASKLRVYNISVAKVKKGDIWVGSLSYEADGEADNVEYKACHEDGTCFTGKAAVNRVLMPTFSGGNITISARACVDPGRSLSQTNCGADTNGTFFQPANAQTAQTELAAQRAQKAERMRAFGVTVKAVIERFQKDSEQCLQNEKDNAKIMAKKQMAASFTAMGEALMGVAVNYAVKTAKAEDVADIERAKKELDPNYTGTVSERSRELQAAGVVVKEDFLVNNPGGKYTPQEIDRAKAEMDPNFTGPISPKTAEIRANNVVISAGDIATAKAETAEGFVGPASPRSNELKDAGILNKADLTKVVVANNENAQTLKTFAGYSNVIANSFAAVGLYRTSPVSSIQMMAMSVFDAFTADDVSHSECIAEQTAKKEMEVLKGQIQQLQQEIAIIDTKLQPTQQGVVLP